MHTNSDLRSCFTDLLTRHVSQLRIAGVKVTGCAPCHDDRSPSFSADLEKGVWYCHACNKGGGVKAFAEIVGEEWSPSQSEPRLARTRRARFQAEQHAQAILRRRRAERDNILLAQHRDAFADAQYCAALLALFYRRPDLAEEFPTLLAHTEHEYSEALFSLSVVAARLDGEFA